MLLLDRPRILKYWIDNPYKELLAVTFQVFDNMGLSINV